ncbi:MAG: PDZ domain-containing protein [Magnetococcales bacterium]|nr:PDZ domain-containing protein [Magnetococcales bacterium]
MKRVSKRIFPMFTALFTLAATPVHAGGWLGITVQPPEGVQVGEIVKDGPADKAGLQKNDILLKADGKVITSLSHFHLTVANATPGKELVLKLLRRGEEREIKITPDDSAHHQSLFPDGRQLGGGEVPQERIWRRGEPWQGAGMPPAMEPGQIENQPARVSGPPLQAPPQPPARGWRADCPLRSPRPVPRDSFPGEWGWFLVTACSDNPPKTAEK